MYDAQLDGHTGFGDASGLPAGFEEISAASAGRQGTAALQAALLVNMLDEIDYGLLVLGADARILLANQLARLELGGERFVRRRQDKLAPNSARDGAKIEGALAKVRRGLRCLVTFSAADAALALSFVPRH